MAARQHVPEKSKLPNKNIHPAKHTIETELRSDVANSNAARDFDVLYGKMMTMDSCCATTWCRCQKNAPMTDDPNGPMETYDQDWQVTSYASYQVWIMFFRIPVFFLFFVQLLIPDSFMSMPGAVTFCGGVLALEILFYIIMELILYCSPNVESSYLLDGVSGGQKGIVWLSILLFVVYFPTFIEERNRTGFNFEAALPSGTGTSTNNAFGQGTQILAIPSNVYTNILIFAVLVFYIGATPFVWGMIWHVLRHGRHPRKYALY